MRSLGRHNVLIYVLLLIIITGAKSQDNISALHSRLEYYYSENELISYFKLIDSIGSITAAHKDLPGLMALCKYVKRDFKGLSGVERLRLRTSSTFLANHISKQTSDKKIPLELYLISHENVASKIHLDSLSWYIENQICIIYIEQGNYEKADYYGALLERSLRHYNKLEFLSRYYINIGRSLSSQLHPEKAKDLFLKGYRLADSIGYHNGIFVNSINLAELYNNNPELGSPSVFINIAGSILPVFFEEKDYQRKKGSFLIESARDTIRKGHHVIGFELFKEGISYLEQFYQAGDLRQMAKQYSQLGLQFLQFDSLEQALNCFYQGLSYLIPESVKNSGLPSERELYAENSFLNLLDLWQSYCEKKYSTTNDIYHLQSAMSANQLALYCNDLIREKLVANGSKLLSVKDNKELIHRGVRYITTLKELDANQEYHGMIRYYFSRSKSLLYSEKRERSQIAGSMTTDDLEKWKSLLDTIQSLRDEKYNDDVDLIAINGSILRCEEKIDELFSSYHNLTRKVQTPAEYIEYLVTDEEIYALAEMNGKRFFGLIGNVKDLDQLLERLNNYISLKGYSMDNDILQDMYDFLIGKVGSVLPERLVIIPDEEIGYIPFEILQDQPGSYLINKITISYLPEYENEVIDINSEETKWDILCLAPEYPKKPGVAETSRGSFFHLPYAEVEIDTIAQLFGDKAFKTRSSEQTEWLPKLTSSRIFHYAGHAVVDGAEAYLALNDEGDILQNLTVEDIRILHLPLDMVVLSACETGLGKLQKGEGIESLGRSFLEAGARSTLISLWNVNDKSTAMIMAAFYKYLREGKPKDESIRLAKLQYLNSISPKLRHPYYWAAFIPAGNMDSI